MNYHHNNTNKTSDKILNKCISQQQPHRYRKSKWVITQNRFSDTGRQSQCDKHTRVSYDYLAHVVIPTIVTVVMVIIVLFTKMITLML